ncbi:MAG TPA: hypothetical protein VFA38_10595, partial [Nitrospirales bacterium]|nr:hypothetical protein [Nitrospirales bacterium]
TVQDHGDHLMATIHALANSDLRQTTDDDAVFFDFFSLGIVWWPEGWTRWMAGGALILLFIAAAIRIRDGETTPAGITAGVVSFFLAVIAAAVVGAGAAWLATLRGPAMWAAQPGPVIAAMWLIGMATAMVCARAFYARAGFDGLFIGHGLCWSAIGIGTTIMLPGGSYLAVVPGMAFALSTTLRATTNFDAAWAALGTSAVTGALWFPIVLPLYDIMGRQTLGVTAVVLAVISTTFTPLAAGAGWMRRSIVAAMGVTAAACVAMQLMIPAITRHSPRRLDIRYIADDESSRWDVDAAPASMRSVTAFEKTDRAATPWLATASGSYSATAPRLPLPPPEVRIVSDDRSAGRTMMLEVRSTRGANAVALIFHAPSLIGLRIDGVAPPQKPPRFVQRLGPGWHAVNVIGAQQALIEITLKKNEPIDAVVADRSSTLPGEAAALVRARDASLGVQSGDGDGVIVRRHVRL